MKRKIYSLLLTLGVFVVSSCELDYLDNPNEVTEKSTDANFLLTRIQTDFADFYSEISENGEALTRMTNQAANTYETAYQPTAYNTEWETAYSDILIDIKTLKTLATKSNLKRHAGIAKTIEAYVIMTMVDSFGDIPYTEALDGNNFNPKADGGAQIYAAALELLKSAKTDFSGTSAGTPVDLFYANNYAKWIKLTNTLQLKNQLNKRLVDKAGATSAINALIAENNMLAAGDDFTFKYGVGENDPDSRHPKYTVQWPNGGGDYQSNYYIWHMTEAKGFDDPRAKYYFYRQVNVNPTNASEIRCLNEFKPNHYAEDMVFCLPGTRGYWGRDHLDNQGIPPDNLKRTIYGVYPAGFRFDDNKSASVSTSDPANKGAGIEPILMASFVDFMLAEAATTLGTTGVAKTLLTSGITKSINAVRAWGLTTSEAAKITAFEPTAAFDASRAKYVKFIETEFDAAATPEAKNYILGREYWIASYGNGVEALNQYKRTGQPANMQPGTIANFGNFPRSFFYPDAYVNRNSNTKQKSDLKLKVFWDTNPDGFIK